MGWGSHKLWLFLILAIVVLLSANFIRSPNEQNTLSFLGANSINATTSTTTSITINSTIINTSSSASSSISSLNTTTSLSTTTISINTTIPTTSTLTTSSSTTTSSTSQLTTSLNTTTILVSLTILSNTTEINLTNTSTLSEGSPSKFFNGTIELANVTTSYQAPNVGNIYLYATSNWTATTFIQLDSTFAQPIFLNNSFFKALNINPDQVQVYQFITESKQTNTIVSNPLLTNLNYTCQPVAGNTVTLNFNGTSFTCYNGRSRFTENYVSSNTLPPMGNSILTNTSYRLTYSSYVTNTYVVKETRNISFWQPINGNVTILANGANKFKIIGQGIPSRTYNWEYLLTTANATSYPQENLSLVGTNQSNYNFTKIRNLPKTSINIDPSWIIPSSVNYIANITLNNLQSTALVAGTPIFIGVNMLNYSQYASGTNHNWELFNGITGNILYQWDSGNTANELQTTSTNTVQDWGIWTVLPSQIVASTNAVNVISLGFLPMGSSSLNGNNVGEAPQLSSTYNAYDNGANIFTGLGGQFWTFGGLSTLPSSWSQISSTTVTFNARNTIIAAPNSAQWYGIYETAPTLVNTTNTVETLMFLNTNQSYFGVTAGTTQIGGSKNVAELAGDFVSGNCPSSNYCFESGAGSTLVSTQLSQSGVPNDISLVFGNPSTTLNSITVGNTLGYNTILGQETGGNGHPVDLGYFTAGCTSAYGYICGEFSVYWMLVRHNPPNNAMPTITFEPVQIATPAIPTITASITPTIATNKNELFTATVFSSNSPYTYNYLVVNSVTNTIIENMLVTNALTSNTWTWHVPANLTGNTIEANVTVTNSNTIPIKANSIYTPIISITFSPSPGSHIINISLDNQQTSPITAGTTILLPFNGLNYSQYFNGNTINLEIFNSITGNILYAWFGGNYLDPSQVAGFNTVSNILLEFTLPSQIAASTNAVNVISIDLISMSSTALNGNNMGLAPQIYCASGCPATSYGQYDNGANVYTVEYQNFKGTSCPTGWSCSGSLYSISNGVQISSGTGSTSVVTTASDFGTGTILDTLAKNLGTPPSDVNLELGYGISSRGSGGEIDLDGAGSSSIGCSNNNYATTFSTAPPNDEMMIFTVNFTPATTTCTYNYTHSVQMSTVSSSADVVGISKNNPYTIGGYVQWLGIRMPPPNNIQPTTVSGPLQEVTGPIPTLTASNTPTVSPNGYELFTANIIGETSPYTYNYQVINTVTGTMIANMLVTNSYTSNTWLWNVPANDVGNTIEANVIITDSFPATINSLYTPAITIQNNIPVYYFVNVSLYNHQSSAISAGTAIMLPFNALNYTSYFNGNNINLEVVNSITGNILYTWFGGNYLNPSQVTGFNSVSNILLEFTLPAQIAASTNAVNVVSVHFISMSITALNGNNVGLAPQIFCSSGCPATTYGEYDNGANVYTTEYQNFGGTSCPAGWSCSGNYLVDNGAEIENGLGSTSIVTTASSFGPGTILDTLAKNFGSTSGYDANLELGYGISSDSSGGQIDLDGAGSSIGCNNNFAASSFSPAPPNNNLMIFTVNFTPATITCSYNYTTSVQTGTYHDYADVVGFSKNNPYTVGGYIQWFGIRTPPPNNIQPTVVFGPIEANVLVTPTIFPNRATFLYANQILNISAFELGGKTPYTYNFIIYNSTYNTILANQLSADNTFLVTTNTLWITNSPVVAYVTVTDSATPNAIINSIKTPDIIVAPPLNLTNSSQEIEMLTNYTYWQDLGYNTINLTALYEANITTNVSSSVLGSWYGYVASANINTVKDVYASWIVQQVNSSYATKKSVQWVGIGGYTNRTLIQVGTSSNASGSHANYSAFYELYGNGNERPLGQLGRGYSFKCNCFTNLEPVEPGDLIEAYVVFSGNITGTWDKYSNWDFDNLPLQTWVIFIRDVNQKWEASGSVPYQSDESSADFISEDPEACTLLIFCSEATYSNYSISKFGNDFAPSSNSPPGGPYNGNIPGTLEATIVNTITGNWTTAPIGKFYPFLDCGGWSSISGCYHTINRLTPDGSSFGVTGSNLSIHIKTDGISSNSTQIVSANMVYITTSNTGATGPDNLNYKWYTANKTFGLTPVKIHGSYATNPYLTIRVITNTIFVVNVTDNGIIPNPIAYNYTTVNVTCGSEIPKNLVVCVPVSIYSNSIIPKGTQIPVYFNASNPLWSTYLTTNSDNICFYNAHTGACMPAWMEGNVSHPVSSNFNISNISTLYWIKTDANISNGVTSNQIFLGIFPKSVDNYGKGLNGILGTNPTFNCSLGCPSKYYGGADNGANVFNLYDNFTGHYSDTSNGYSTNSTIDSIFSAHVADWSVNNGLTFTQTAVAGSGCSPSCYSYPYAEIYLNSTKYTFNKNINLSFDVDNIGSFYGGSTDICYPYHCYQYNYDPSQATLGFYDINTITESPNSLDMGGIEDSYASGCNDSCQQNYLYTNNGIALNSIIFFANNSQASFPLTITLINSTLYAQSLYSTNTINKTTQQFSGFSVNDVFTIGDGTYSKDSSTWSTYPAFNWFRTRTPPPNDIFPVSNMFN